MTSSNQKEIEELTKKLNDSNILKEQLEAEIADIKKTVETTKESLSSSNQKEIEKLNLEIADLKANEERKKKQLQDKIEELEDISNKVKEFEQKAVKLNDAVIKKEIEYENGLKNLKNKDEENIKLKTEYEEKLTKKDRAITTLSQDKIKLQTDINELKIKLESVSENLNNNSTYHLPDIFTKETSTPEARADVINKLIEADGTFKINDYINLEREKIEEDPLKKLGSYVNKLKMYFDILKDDIFIKYLSLLTNLTVYKVMIEQINELKAEDVLHLFFNLSNVKNILDIIYFVDESKVKMEKMVSRDQSILAIFTKEFIPGIPPITNENKYIFSYIFLKDITETINNKNVSTLLTNEKVAKDLLFIIKFYQNAIISLNTTHNILHKQKQLLFGYYTKNFNDKKKVSTFIKFRRDTTAYNPLFHYVIQDTGNKVVEGLDIKTKQLLLQYTNIPNRVGYKPESLEYDRDYALAEIAENSNKNEYYFLGPYEGIYDNPNISNTEVATEMAQSLFKQLIEKNKNLFIVGYGQSGVGKTTSLIYKKTNDIVEDGILVCLCNIPEFTNKYESLTLKVKNIYLRHNTYHESPEQIQSTDYVVTDIGIGDDINPKFSFKNKGTTEGWFYNKNEEKNLAECINDSFSNRQVEPTPLNPDSSRSHVIVDIILKHKGTNNVSHIVLCDLAGVESKYKIKDITIDDIRELELSTTQSKKYNKNNPDSKELDFDRKFCDQICNAITSISIKEDGVDNNQEGCFKTEEIKNQYFLQEYNDNVVEMAKNILDFYKITNFTWNKDKPNVLLTDPINTSIGSQKDFIKLCKNEQDIDSPPISNINKIFESFQKDDKLLNKINSKLNKTNVENECINLAQELELQGCSKQLQSKIDSFKTIKDFENNLLKQINESKRQVSLWKNVYAVVCFCELLIKIATDVNTEKTPSIIKKEFESNLNINKLTVLDSTLTQRYKLKEDNLGTIEYPKSGKQKISKEELADVKITNIAIGSDSEFFAKDVLMNIQVINSVVILIVHGFLVGYDSEAPTPTYTNSPSYRKQHLYSKVTDIISYGNIVKRAYVNACEIYKNNLCEYHRLKKHLYRYALRGSESDFINRSLKDIRDDIKTIILKSTISETGLMPLVYDRDIFPYCRNTHIEEEYFDRFYDNNKDTTTSGIILDIIQKQFNIKPESLYFVIFTVINLTDNGKINNPPNPPYINISRLISLSNKQNKKNPEEMNQELFEEIQYILMNTIEYKFYKNNITFKDLLKTFEELKKTRTTIDPTIVRNMKDNIIEIGKTLITLIQSNNPSTLVGSLESTDIIQNILYDNIICCYDSKMKYMFDRFSKQHIKETEFEGYPDNKTPKDFFITKNNKK